MTNYRRQMCRKSAGTFASFGAKILPAWGSPFPAWLILYWSFSGPTSWFCWIWIQHFYMSLDHFHLVFGRWELMLISVKQKAQMCCSHFGLKVTFRPFDDRVFWAWSVWELSTSNLDLTCRSCKFTNVIQKLLGHTSSNTKFDYYNFGHFVKTKTVNAFKNPLDSWRSCLQILYKKYMMKSVFFFWKKYVIFSQHNPHDFDRSNMCNSALNVFQSLNFLFTKKKSPAYY